MMQALLSLWSQSPPQLKSLCLKYIAENVDILKRKDVQLPIEVWESIIDMYQRLGYTVDDHLLACTNCHIKRLHLRNADVTDAGLIVVLTQQLVELDLRNCDRLTPNLIQYLNQYGGDSLQSLTLANNGSLLTGMPALCISNGSFDIKLRNLKKLIINDLSGCETRLKSLISPVRNLTHLDLSNCCNLGDLSYITALENLTSLILYNVKEMHFTILSVCKLKNLRHLDLSQPVPKETPRMYKRPDYYLDLIVTSLPHLLSLDISGSNLAGKGPVAMAKDGISDIPGLVSRAGNPLHFLGLFYTSHAASTRHHIPAKVVSGDANEAQLLVAASAYMERPPMLKNVLHEIFFILRNEMFNDWKECLHTVIQIMDRHLNDESIQTTGSASLYYLMKHLQKGQHTQTKQRLMWTLLNGLEAHATATMMKNCCLILTLILRFTPHELFYFERIVKLTLLRVETGDGPIRRNGITLLNSIAVTVDSKDKELMGDYGTIHRMLAVIEYQLKKQLSGEILDTAWSTMWNATDETPKNCQRFLDGNGMDLFLRCLRAFPKKEEMIRNMLGLLGNVAEVSWLRPNLMNSRFVQEITKLLDYDGIEVSYNAAGVLSNMASDGEEFWTIDDPSRVEALRRMVFAIECWDLSTQRFIHYRSFEPILGLLQKSHTPECQHWAAWALANLTRVYPDKYCPLLESENGIPLLRHLLETDVNERVKLLCQMVIDQCQHLGKGYIPMEVEEYVEEDDNGDEDVDDNDDGDMQLDG
ncbi:protein zer-1 homolog [Thrips palmi]|uniref:Protein zer-1 homolog n=1 Tax=Thrips palmi TaxID=161013 RepID=A0A6P8XYZ5_THRPL|nr:protein zer-1 homolog [Thrips palmi]